MLNGNRMRRVNACDRADHARLDGHGHGYRAFLCECAHARERGCVHDYEPSPTRGYAGEYAGVDVRESRSLATSGA